MILEILDWTVRILLGIVVVLIIAGLAAKWYIARLKRKLAEREAEINISRFFLSSGVGKVYVTLSGDSRFESIGVIEEKSKQQKIIDIYHFSEN